MLSLVFVQGAQGITIQEYLTGKANVYLMQNKSTFGVNPQDLNLTEILKDSTQESVIPWTIWYKQSYKNVPVYAAEIRIHFDKNDNVSGTINRLVPNINLSVNPAITKDAVKEIIKQKYDQNVQFDALSEPVLMILDINSPKLAWYSTLPYSVGRYIFVDAQNGVILQENPNWVSENAVNAEDNLIVNNVISTSDNLTIILALAVIVILIILVSGYFIIKSEKLK